MSLLIFFRNNITIPPPEPVLTIDGMTGEFFTPYNLYDLIYINTDEGTGSVSFDRADVGNDHNLQLFGEYSWNNYKTDKLNGYTYRHANYLFTLEGIKRI